MTAEKLTFWLKIIKEEMNIWRSSKRPFKSNMINQPTLYVNWLITVNLRRVSSSSAVELAMSGVTQKSHFTQLKPRNVDSTNVFIMC